MHLASRDELRREVEHAARQRALTDHPLPAWTRELSDRDSAARRDVALAVEAFHAVAFAGRWAHMQSYLEVAAERMARTIATEGVERLFAGLAPFARWRAPVRHQATTLGIALLDGDLDGGVRIA